MGLLNFLMGGKVALDKPIQAIGNVLDDLFTSDEEKLDKKIILHRLYNQPHILQAHINQTEAQHKSLWVAGWRPAVGWVCAVSLFWHFMLFDLLQWIMLSFFPEIPQLTQLTGTDTLVTLLLSLLGLGGLRTFEKYQNVNKNP